MSAGTADTASTTTSDVTHNGHLVVPTSLEGLEIAEDGEILGGLVPPHLLGVGGDDLSMTGPVTCHDCGRSYSTVSHLKQHRRSKHEGVVWKCAHDGCDKSYCDPSTLRKHVRSSHEGVTFECIEPSCKKIYHQRGHMLRHYASKHLNKRHICDAPQCTNKYAHADNLRRHKLRDHKDLLESGALMLTSNVTTTRGASSEAIVAAASLRSDDDAQNASTADVSKNGNGLHALNGLIDVVPQGRAAVDAMVPPPPPAAKRGRKRKVPLEMSMALPPPPPPPPPRPLPVEETDADGTVTTTLDGGSILPLPKKRGRKPKNPPASISVGIEMPQNLIHVQQQLPSLSMREFNSPFVSVLPPLPPPPPPPDLSLLSKTHGLPNGHVHLPLMPNANGVVFGGAVPPPPPQFALVQALNGRFSSLPPPPPMHVDRFGDGGFGHGNASFLHHPVPPRRVP